MCGTELTPTIHLFGCLAFGNGETNTLKGKGEGGKNNAWVEYFEQTKIKSWCCHIKRGEGMDLSTYSGDSVGKENEESEIQSEQSQSVKNILSVSFV